MYYGIYACLCRWCRIRNSCEANADGAIDFVEGQCDQPKNCPATIEIAVDCAPGYQYMTKYNQETQCEEVGECVPTGDTAIVNPEICPMMDYMPMQCMPGEVSQPTYDGECMTGYECVSTGDTTVVNPEICPLIAYMPMQCEQGKVSQPTYDGNCMNGYECVPNDSIGEPLVCPAIYFEPIFCPQGETMEATYAGGCMNGYQCVPNGASIDPIILN